MYSFKDSLFDCCAHRGNYIQLMGFRLATRLEASSACLFRLIKDIVQPKKRGVKRGTIRFVLTSYTIADIF
jgi:hypothetical protein